MAWTAPPTRASTITSYRSRRTASDELGPGDLAQRVGAYAHLGELAHGRRGPAAQQEAVEVDAEPSATPSGTMRRAVSAPHFHRVSESASTATRKG